MAIARKNKQLELSSIPWGQTKPRPKKPRIPWLQKSARPAQPGTQSTLAQLQNAQRKALGEQAESQALEYLQSRGLTLIERNHRCRCGEVDLLMFTGKTAVVVEVRHRSSPTHGGAADSVTPRKQTRVSRCAMLWWVRTGQRQFTHLRFDVVALGTEHPPHWIQNAWQINSEGRTSY